MLEHVLPSLDFTFDSRVSVYHVPRKRCRCKFRWSTLTCRVIGCTAVLIPRWVITLTVSFAVCMPILHFLASSSGVAFECRSFVITLEIFHSSFHSWTSLQYVDAMLTADIKEVQNSLELYTLDILPSSISVSPYCSSCPLLLAELICRCCLVIPDVRDRIVRISMLSRLCRSGRRTSSVGFHTSLVMRITWQMFLLPLRWCARLEVYDCPRGIEGDENFVAIDAKFAT